MELIEIEINKLTVKEIKGHLKGYDLYKGLSHMRKAELVQYVYRIITGASMRDNGNGEFHTEFDRLFLPNTMANKLRAFRGFKYNVSINKIRKRASQSYKFRLLKEYFNILTDLLKDREFNKVIEESGLSPEIIEHESHIETKIKMESIKYDTHIDYYDTPHKTKLIKMMKLYDIEKEYGEFDNSDIKYLYHGCDKTTLDSILEHGNFSLLMSGKKHGQRYGPGIYLTEKLWKAAQYSETHIKKAHYKYVLLCKVLVKNIYVANHKDILFPSGPLAKSYDTSVDRLVDPIEYIKKDTNHICIIGFMRIYIPIRGCLLLNHVKKPQPIQNKLVSISFVNNITSDTVENLSIYWYNTISTPAYEKFMGNLIDIHSIRSISTLVGHQFNIYKINKNNIKRFYKTIIINTTIYNSRVISIE